MGKASQTGGVITVGVRVPGSMPVLRPVLRGIVSYVRSAGLPWRIHTEVDSDHELLPVSVDQEWEGDGLIIHRPTVREVEVFGRKGIPLINLSTEGDHPGVPSLQPDNREVGLIASDALLQLGLASYTMVARPGRRYAQERWRAFEAGLMRAGKRARLVEFDVNSMEPCEKAGRFRAGLIELLAGLERPAGVFGVDDIMAAAVIEACQCAGFGVPDDVAVVGFGNCEILCMTTAPPLTSIPFPAKEMGYHAARSLHLLMEGKGQEVPSRRALPIGGIRVRESTDTLAGGDPIIARAVRIIRERAPNYPLRVSELVDMLPVSRSTLKQRFAAQLGHPAKDEIQRVRLAALKQRLRTSGAAVSEIAHSMMFESPEELSRFFKRQTGQTPSEYRREQAGAG